LQTEAGSSNRTELPAAANADPSSVAAYLQGGGGFSPPPGAGSEVICPEGTRSWITSTNNSFLMG